MASYKAWMDVGETNLYTNGLSFATESEATSYAEDLMWRWTQVIGYTIKEQDAPATHRFENNCIYPLEEQHVLDNI